LPSETTGECWGISAHPNGPNEVLNGPLKGNTLNDVWDKHRELFGNQKGDNFPLLVKILDAKTDLSVQVHPNDTYAREVEGDAFGKTECWYVIDCEPGAELVYGHHANSKHEFKELVEHSSWSELLRKITIKPGDFVYVPNGTIHAIGSGTMILETQQSSDITYRLYDYDRLDDAGNKRELHIEKSVEVAKIPHEDVKFEQVETTVDDLKIKKLIQEKYFTVYHWMLRGYANLIQENSFLQVSVIKGNCTLTSEGNDYFINKGDHFIIPSTIKKYIISGNAEFIVSHI
jgi:mannose-6-phosphate isomerase